MATITTPADLLSVDFTVDNEAGENSAEVATAAWTAAAEAAGLEVADVDPDAVGGFRDDKHAGAVEHDGRVYLLEVDGSEVRAVKYGEYVHVSVVEGDQARDCQAVRGGELNLPRRVIDWAEDHGATADRPELYLLVETEEIAEIAEQLQGLVVGARFVFPADLVAQVREIAAEEAAQD